MRILKFSILICYILINCAGCASAQVKEGTNDNPQNAFIGEVYDSFKDFKKQSPSRQENLTIEVKKDSIAYRFINLKNSKKEKKAFAVKIDNDLYVRIIPMRKTLKGKDRSQAWYGGNYYLKNKINGKYIVFEDYFYSPLGVMLPPITSEITKELKAVLYDTEKKRFDIIRNEEEFRNFLNENHPEKLTMLKNDQEKEMALIITIRKIIKELNQE